MSNAAKRTINSIMIEGTIKNNINNNVDFLRCLMGGFCVASGGFQNSGRQNTRI